jgi:glycosyltransferase involved in cell wall biosynthesis
MTATIDELKSGDFSTKRTSVQPIDQQGYGGCDRLGAVRIVIDYRPALRARTGVGEYIYQLARALGRRGEDEVTLFSASWKDRARGDLAPDVPDARVIDRRIPVRVLNFTWHRLEWPPVEALTKGPYDIAHSPHPLLMPSRSAARVVTIHDLHFLSRPDRAAREIKRDYSTLVGDHARRADRIIVSSQFAAHEIKRHLGVQPEKIAVCPAGAPDWTTPPRSAGADGYILFVGTLEPRKNIGGLLDAYGRLRERIPHPPRLVLAGAAGQEAGLWLESIARAPLAGHIEHRGYVPSSEREALYKGAQLLVLPSFEEGFGLTVLEAMAAGVPVIASNRGSLPEVVGQAGLLVDPDDPETITGAMESLVSDAVLRANCARLGLERVREFSWSQTAGDVRRAYDEAVRAKQQLRAATLSHAHRH